MHEEPEFCAQGIHFADSQPDLVLEGEVRGDGKRCDGGNVGASGLGAGNDRGAVTGGLIAFWRKDGDGMAMGIGPSDPAFGEGDVGVGLTRLGAGERRVGFFGVKEGVVFGLDEQCGKFLMIRFVGDCRGGVDFELHVEEIVLQGDCLAEDDVFEFFPGGPMSRLGFDLKRVGGEGFEFENFGGLVAPVAALHGIVAPGFAIPVGAVGIAVVALLEVAAAVVGVQKVFVGFGGGRDPSDAGTGVEIDADSEVFVGDEMPAGGGGFAEEENAGSQQDGDDGEEKAAHGDERIRWSRDFLEPNFRKCASLALQRRSSPGSPLTKLVFSAIAKCGNS